MVGVTKWLSILVLVSALINFVQEQFGIVTIPPLDDNNLIQFFYVSLAPLIEEVGFRLILIGIPLFALYSRRTSVKYFFKCLWSPRNLDIYDSKKAILLIVFVGILFGFAILHLQNLGLKENLLRLLLWNYFLGWVYLRFGFVASLLIHWATNYFIFSYATFYLRLIQFLLKVHLHSLMSTLELFF